MARNKKGNKKTNKPNIMNAPESMPFIEAVEKRFNARVSRKDEKGLLSTYERNWNLVGTLCDIDKQEARYVRYLANKHHSFIVNKI